MWVSQGALVFRGLVLTQGAEFAIRVPLERRRIMQKNISQTLRFEWFLIVE